MSKTGWANAVGSIGQGLLVFGANREKLNYEKERDANMLELEREQMVALEKHQGLLIEQGNEGLKIQGNLAKSSIAVDKQSIKTAVEQAASLKQSSELELGEFRQKKQEFENAQRLSGMEKTTLEDGTSSYVFSEALFAETQNERDSARLAGSSVAAAVQGIQENTNSMIEARNDNPTDPQYMKDVKNDDGTTTKVPMTDSDLRVKANQQYQQSLQSTQTLQATAAIKGLDNQISAINKQRQSLIEDMLVDNKEKDLNGKTDKQRRIEKLDDALNTLEQTRMGWTSVLSAGPQAPSRFNSNSTNFAPPPDPNNTGAGTTGVEEMRNMIGNGEISE